MIRKITLLFLLCLGMQSIVQAQYCGFDKAKQRLLLQDPAYAQKLRELSTNWVSWVNSTPNSNPNSLLANNGTSMVYQIPVVIHVVVPGDPSNPTFAQGTIYNPTDAQLIAMIAYLNQTYAGSYASYPDSNNGGTSIPIQFVLAKRDPSCNLTTGIVRENGSGIANYVTGGVNNGSGTGATEVAVKGLGRWDVNEYYNIWVVNKIDGQDGTAVGIPFTAGYAYLPGANVNLDGIIILATQALAGDITIPHEMGHMLSVLHTFEGGTTTTCPPNVNCNTDGDQICDTDPERQSNFNCPSDGSNICTPPLKLYHNVQHNFMDYSNCQDRFTPGQRTRMLFGLTKYRTNLLGSQGGIDPTTVSAPTATQCATVPPSCNSCFGGDAAGVYEVKIADNTNSLSYYGIDAPYVYLDYKSGGFSADGSAYVDHTCTQSATLVAGNDYKFFVTSGPNTTGENIAIYIDYNNDGLFTPDELLYTHIGTTANELDSVVATLPTVLTNPGMVTCTPVRMRVISDPNGLLDPCGPVNSGQIEDYAVTITGSGSSGGSVTVSPPPFTDTTCLGSAITYTATPSAGILPPVTYKWFINGIQQGSTTGTFTTSTITNGQLVTATVYFVNNCGHADSATSAPLTAHRASTGLTAQVFAALTSGLNPGCAGFPLTFTATPVNGGNGPTYQWYVNGVADPFGTGTTYTNSTLAANDQVTVIMVSNASCVASKTVQSNAITIVQYTLTAGITITASANPGCSGQPITFLATATNAGPSPTYQWTVNGAAVASATSPAFVTNSLATGDQVECVLTAPGQCITNHLVASAPITMTINQTLDPSATIAITAGNNPGCIDSPVTFTPSISNAGSTPTITWLVNSLQAFTGTSYTTDSLNNGDVVYAMITIASGGCYSSNTFNSNAITMALTKTPNPPVISLIGKQLVANSGTILAWYGPIPSGLIAGQNSPFYQPTQKGYYYAEIVDSNCHSKPSDTLNVSFNNGTGVSTLNLSAMRIYPNPTTGQITLDWGNLDVTMHINVYNSIGQSIVQSEMNNESKKTIDLTGFANGNYFIVLRNEDGEVLTTSIALNK